MRRRREQGHARGRVPDLRNPRIHLVTRELSTLAGLRALRHLDLKVVGIDEVLARDAEPGGGDLLDRTTAPVAVRIAPVARRVFTTLAGVRFGTEAVHRDRKRFVRFLTDRAVRHGAGCEALDDRLDRLHLAEWNGRSRLEVEKPA